MDSRVILTVIVCLTYHLTEAVVCGPKECTNIGEPCQNKRDKVCVDGFCRTCFCANSTQCYMQKRRDTGCDCSDSVLTGKYCNCSECGTCDDVFGFSKPCKRLTTDFGCRRLGVRWKVATERMHASNETFAKCKGLCLMNDGCKLFQFKGDPEPVCYLYEPTSFLKNNLEIPTGNKSLDTDTRATKPNNKTKDYWYTCFRKCEFC